MPKDRKTGSTGRYTTTSALSQARRAHMQGRLREAEAQIAAVLEKDPHDAEAVHLLGMIAFTAGKTADAARLFAHALKLEERAEFHESLGIAAMTLGHREPGIAHLRRAVALKPGLATAHYNLGTALTGIGDVKGAVEAFRKALRHDSRNPMTHVNLGIALARRQERDESLKHLRRATALNPRDGDVWCALGETLLGFAEPVEACDALAKAVDRAPDSARAWFGLGNARQAAGNPRLAVPAFERAIAIDPDLGPAHHNLGLALLATGAPESAEACFRRAIALQPAETEPRLNLAEALIAQNREAEALVLYRELHDREPANTRIAIRAASLLQNTGAFEDARGIIDAIAGQPGQTAAVFCLQAEDRSFPIPTETLEQALVLAKNPAVPDQERVDVNFALGKVLERAKRYDEAFDCLVRANALKAVACPYDPKAEETFVTDLQRVYTPEFLSQRADWGDPRELPIFIVGLPRSGTTLTEQILASHADIEGAGELFDIERILDTLRDIDNVPYPGGGENLTAETVRRHAGRYIERRLTSFPGARRVVDKMHMNFRHVGFMALLFPHARFIHCRRDPMDNGLSIFAQQFRQDYYAYAYDLGALGHYTRLHERLMDHWKAVLPGRILTVRYEDLVDDVESGARDLVAFCDLEWDPACLRFHEKERAVRTASQWQVRQPIYRTSVERWRRFERQLAPLAEALARDLSE